MAVFSGNGSNTAPSFTFSSDTDTGLYRIAEDRLAITTGGVQHVEVDASGDIRQGTTTGFNNTGTVLRKAGGATFYKSSATTNSNNILTVFNNQSSLTNGQRASITITNTNDGGASSAVSLESEATNASATGGSNFNLYTRRDGNVNGEKRLTVNNFGSLLIGGTLPSSPNASISYSGRVTCKELRGTNTSFAADGNWQDVIPSTFANGAWWIVANVAASGYHHTMIAVATLSFGDGDFNILCNSNYNSQTQTVMSLQWTPSTLNGSQTLQIKTAANVPGSSANFKVISVL